MPKIRDNLTGEIFEVDESQLSKFGLSAPQPQSPLTATPSAQVSPALQQMMPSMGQQPEVDPDQSAYQQAWKIAKTLKDQQAIAEAWKGAKGYDLFGKAKKEGANAISEVMNQPGGRKLLEGIKTKDERESVSQEILDIGGVQKYRETLSLGDLMTDKENDANKIATELLGSIDQAIPYFSKGGPMGTGPLARLIPEWALTLTGDERTKEMRRQAESITAEKLLALSGKVISDKEAERLKKFLPKSEKTEETNYGDLQKLKRDLERNLEIFEKSKREGLSIIEAYKKYKNEYGLGEGNEMKDVDYYLKKYMSPQMPQGNMPTGRSSSFGSLLGMR